MQLMTTCLFSQGSRGEVGPEGSPGITGKLVSDVSNLYAVASYKADKVLETGMGRKTNLQQVV